MKKLSSKLLMLMCGLVLAGSSIHAEDPTTTSDHIPVGIRSVTEEERIEHEQARANMAVKQAKQAKKSKSASLFGARSLEVFYTTHPGAYHHPVVISAFGDSLEFEDGSIWAVKASDAYITLNWLPSDVVVITPNHAWFSSYAYRLTNQNTGASVAVNMYLGPFYNGPYTHWITGIDYYNNMVYLEDGSVWTISWFDNSVIDKWVVNDTVIIGVNDGWQANSRPNLLINVNMLNHAAATAAY